MLHPLGCNGLKRAFCTRSRADLLSLPNSHRVRTCGELPASRSVALSGSRQGHFRVFAKRHELLSATEAVFPAPQLATRRRHKQVQPFSIGNPVSPLLRIGIANLHICQRHDSSQNLFLQKYHHIREFVPPQVAPYKSDCKRVLAKGGEQVIGK